MWIEHYEVREFASRNNITDAGRRTMTDAALVPELGARSTRTGGIPFR